ncbi:hypothetical protein LTR66_017685, partial [Elasticomyces elasticus]
MAAPESRDFSAEISPDAAKMPEITKPLQQAPNARASVHFQNVFADDDDSVQDQPERYMMDTMAMRPRSMSHHLSSAKVPSRRWLTFK